MRLSTELEDIRGILNRGYIIIPGAQGIVGSKHKPLDVTERGYYTNKKLDLENEIFDLKVELSDIEADLKEKLSRNKLSGKQKLQKKRADQQVIKTTATLKAVMLDASKNGEAGKLVEVNALILDDKKSEAVKSLMSFLREKVKGPFRKIDADEKFASKVSAELVEFLPKLIPN
jgi:hypothetical protein